MRWVLHVEYDGAAFAGWQLQDNAPTIQGALEQALASLVQHPVRVHGAGRTDAGVHAEMQVAVFDTTAVRTPRQIRDGLNALLPAPIACVAAWAGADDFDPRRAPHTKTYRYTWLVRSARSPLRAGRHWLVRPPVDGDAMGEAAAAFVGTHDLSSFRAEGCTANTTVRTIQAARVERAGDELVLRVEGTGFLRHTVRILAGTLYEIGRGARPVPWLAEVLAARDRAAAGRTAPAEGLVLEKIVYG